MKYREEDLQTASDKAIAMHEGLLGADMGMVSLYQQQEVAFAFNTNMKRGYIVGKGTAAVVLRDTALRDTEQI